MELEQYIGLGLLLLGLWLALMRFYERSWFPPASIFAIGFFLHGFFTAQVYYEEGQIRYDQLVQILPLTSMSFAAAITGYCARLPRPKWWVQRHEATSLVGTFGVKLIGGATLFLLAYLTVYCIISGQLALPKGFDAYKTEVSLSGRIAKVGLIIPALMSAWLINILEGKCRRRTWLAIWLIAMGWQVGLSMLLFERKSVVSSILMVGIYSYYRRHISFRQLLPALFLGIIALQLTADLRIFNIGVTDLSSEEVGEFLKEMLLERPWMLLYGIGTSIAGQNVFAAVVELVPSSYPFKMGVTYLKSITGLFRPRFLGLSSYGDPDLPSNWFHEAYDPNVEHHGFDFSMLAEAYLNFGSAMIGVFFVIGMLIRRASESVRYSQSLFAVLLGILTIMGLTFGLRSDSNTVLKSIIYPFLSVWIIRKVAGSRRV